MQISPNLFTMSINPANCAIPVLDAFTVAELADEVPGLIGDLRSDHAGETGAVAIYRGILAMSRDLAVRNFAVAHLATEQEHLARLGAILTPGRRSILLPVWRVAGWLTGALPALVGPRAVYATIDAVETFVDHHYDEQVRKLPGHGSAGALRALLVACQADEVEHRDQARAAGTGAAGTLTQAWKWLVGTGSALAVMAARRI
ncbi:MAG TPA: demethoxyubiquinone hydroxylase family protein [Acidocella sp.]|nr:demethoxyubiquinone hydroxylase family protein [Acidocella sp.]